VIKVELHSHTSEDPVDRIPYTSAQLIDHAATLGFGAVAITLHERQLDVRRLARHAAERGIVLIRGIERSIEGRHVLLLNFRDGTEDIETFDDLARLKRRQRQGLVVAPHPFFPALSCLRGQLAKHAALFDAVEWNAMFTRTINFNAPAARWAKRHGKPLVGNGDVHRLEQLGTTYSLVDADPDADAICAAIAKGEVQVVAMPLSLPTAARIMTDLLIRRRHRVPYIVPVAEP
jgi:predicted metal-dependent phosphoesterase TrpH